MMIEMDVRAKELKPGQMFLTRLTKRTGLVQVINFSEEPEDDGALESVTVELLDDSGVIERKEIHPMIRVDLINSVVG